MSDRTNRVYIFQGCNREIQTCNVAYLLWAIFSPIYFVVGTVGNVLCFIVLMRKKMRVLSLTVHLQFLSVCDILVLYSHLFRSWQEYTYNYDFRTSHSVACKIGVWMVAASTACSFWILALVTVERVIAVRFPLFAKVHLTRKARLISLVILVTSIGLMSLHTVVYFDIADVSIERPGGVNNSSKRDVFSQCVPIGEKYEDFVHNAWQWIILVTYCCAPFLVILIGNIIVAATLFAAKRDMRRIGPANTAVANPRTFSRRSWKTNSSRTMLFALSGFFLVSTLPICVYLVVYQYMGANESEEAMSKSELWWAIVNMFFYANNTFNFILYCVAGSVFRGEVKDMAKTMSRSFQHRFRKQSVFTTRKRKQTDELVLR